VVKAWRVILAALVIFAAGVVTGGLTVRLSQNNVPARPTQGPVGLGPFRQRGDMELLDRMQRQLYLSGAQRTRIEQILHDNHERMKQLWESIAPQAQAERRHVNELIRGELNADQQKKFDEVFKSRGPNHLGDERRRRGEEWRDQKPSRKPELPSSSNTTQNAEH
jgi:hypothetical protein